MSIEIIKKFENVRKLFPHTKKTVYFNSASYGPFCRPVATAVEDNLKLRLLCERDDSHDAFIALDKLRKDYARLVGAKHKEIGIGMNTTFGLNLAAFGLPLKKGDEILLCDNEFPALIYTFKAAAEAKGLKLKFLKSNNNTFDIDNLNKSITKKTKLLAISYVQFFNGFKNDLAEISKICKKHGIYFVVDGIQGMGVEPLNLSRLGVDIFTSGCQKWMLSPQGCGFFYLSEEIQKVMNPPFMSWLGVDWKVQFTDLFRYELPYFESSRKYEMGYYAILNILAMNAAVEIFKDLGIKNIQKHNYGLIDKLADFIANEPFYQITSSMVKKHRSSIFTFTSNKIVELHKEILRNKIILVRREGSIRVSVHLFNNEKDINKLIKVLKMFAKKNR